MEHEESNFTSKTGNSRGLQIGIGMLLLLLVGLGAYFLERFSASSVPPASGKINIVAAENFWGDIAFQIGGNHVQVTSIITDPTTDPHLYESDARDAAAVGSANLIIENGLGYDDFIDKLLSTSSNGARKLLSVQKALGVSGSDTNPHLWYDTSRVADVAAAIEEQLAAIDPNDAVTYKRNLSRFVGSLQPITATIAEIKRKYSGLPVAYTERVPEYLLTNAGLNIKTPTGFASAVENGNEPSPADTEAMDNLMTNHGVRVLLYNAQTTSLVTQHVKDLATRSGIPVIGVAETLPANEPDFQSWQLAQSKALLAALGG